MRNPFPTPFLSNATPSRRWFWTVADVRGQYKRFSGFFASEASAERWFRRQAREFGATFYL